MTTYAGVAAAVSSGVANDSAATPLDTLTFPLSGSQLIEASAGTGKTYTIASLYVRLVLGHGSAPEQKPLTPPEILVVTFTVAAMQELRDRIRKRLNEAAACFLGEAQGDDFLQGLRSDYPQERWPACARTLQIAAEWMDEAAVSTIDAWCYRMLREHAFDSASLFDVEMDLDGGQRVAEATRDYWRLHIALLPPDDLEIVLKLIAANKKNDEAGGCDGLARILKKNWLARADHYDSVPGPAEIFADLRERSATCKAQWQQWVPEMRQLLQAAYDANHYQKGLMPVSSWKSWLRKLQEWADDPSARRPFGDDKAWSRLMPAGLAEVWKVGAPPQHPGFEAIDGLRTQISEMEAGIARLWPHAAKWVQQRVEHLRRQRAMLDFEGLLRQLDAALTGTNGQKLAQAIRKQFPAALIDEFQDTNPVQYRIFDRIYNVASNSTTSLLALIGDPKQAIYRFRGADIHAYLAARRACAGRIHTLGSNYRSSSAMVDAVNHLFLTAEENRDRGAFLFRGGAGSGGAADNPVPFQPVVAAKDPGEWIVEGEPAQALTLWRDTSHTGATDYFAVVAQACASEILRLLQAAAAGDAGFRKQGTLVPLRARDIAILVNTGKEAQAVQSELSRRGIRSVYLSDSTSVFGSDAVFDVLAWLRACAEPDNGEYVRAALATAALGQSWKQLDSYVRDESLWESMLDKFAGYKEYWRQRGVLPMLRRFMHDFGVPARLFSMPGDAHVTGERHLTDLLHLAELLQARSNTLDGEHALIRYLEERLEPDGVPEKDDVSRLRLESDAGLVQVVTVHKSKGLEYPLVFYPYAYNCYPVRKLQLPAIYRDAQGKEAVLASPGDADETLLGTIAAQQEHERLAEDMRKLYVALTRARHATWMAVVPTDTLPLSAMGYLLGGAAKGGPDTLESAVAALAADCANIDVTGFPATLEGRYHQQIAASQPAVWRHMGRRIEQSWDMNSYSGLARLAIERPENAAALRENAAQLALPDDPRHESFMESYLADMQDGAGGDDPASPGGAGRADQAPGEAAGIHDFPRGAAPGSFLHGLLEWMFRQGPQRVLSDLPALRNVIERRCRSRGWQKHAEAVFNWLVSFFTKQFRLALPYCGPQRSLVLGELVPALAEMEFWFGVRDTDIPTLDALVKRHFIPGAPRPSIARGRLNGLLRGFVDLVFEHDGRYYVADYKSTWFGPSKDAYHHTAIARRVLEHRYELQAAIYLFALHRLLESRLGDAYDYDRHMGGALIFFIRGDAAPSQGVHIERPTHEVMQEMAQVFEGQAA